MTEPARKLTVRKARVEDSDLVIRCIHALAEYERLAGPTPAGEERIRAYGWGDQPLFDVLLVFENEVPTGFALYGYQFSTFAARPTLYLEDLFVYPEYRGHGCGRALLKALAHEAVARGCGRMDWLVLDWNTPAIDFYRRLGAEMLTEWMLCRFDAEVLERLAEDPTPAA